MTTNELYPNVIRILHERRMQQKDLAEKMGCAPAFLSKALTGNPTLDTIKRIATALEVPLTTLVEERNTIDGYLRINGEAHHVVSIKEIEKIINHLQFIS